MYKGTTPTLTLTFDESIDFSEAAHIVVTFATDYHKVIMEKNETEITVNAHSLKIDFTQKETLAICTGKMLIQVNVLYEDGNRVSSEIKEIDWENNLKNEVMV